MNKIFLILLIHVLCCKCSNAQLIQDSIFHNKEFKWTITIPEGFANVDPATWAKMQNQGTTLIEDTYGQKIENNTTSIFIFKSNQFNYFECCAQPFDTAVDGNYIETCKGVANMLYKTFENQIKNSVLDTSFETEKIDGLEFQKFKMKITYPNNTVFNLCMYTRLFGKKEFAVNIMYIDDIKGYLMLNAWKRSRFEK